MAFLPLQVRIPFFLATARAVGYSLAAMAMQEEREVECPFCGETITVLLDPSIDDEQTYIEDCSVCCRPIQFMFSCENGTVTNLEVERGD